MVEIRLVGKYDEVLIAKKKLTQLFPPVSESVIAHNETGKGYKVYINSIVPSSFEHLGVYDKTSYGLYNLNTGESITEDEAGIPVDVDKYEEDYNSIVNDVSPKDRRPYLTFADFEDVDGM